MKTLFYRKIILLVIFVLASITIYGQMLIDNTDCLKRDNTISEKFSIQERLDIEDIKVSEIGHSSSNKIEYKKYFSREGKEITDYVWGIDIKIKKKIQNRIKELFNFNDRTECVGTSLLLLLIDNENDVFEIRVIKGITDEYNKELLKAVKILEENIVCVCSETLPKAVAVLFPLNLTIEK